MSYRLHARNARIYNYDLRYLIDRVKTKKYKSWIIYDNDTSEEVLSNWAFCVQRDLQYLKINKK